MRTFSPLVRAALFLPLLFTACKKEEKELRNCRLRAAAYQRTGIRERYDFTYENELSDRVASIVRKTDSSNGERSTGLITVRYFGTSAVAIHRSATDSAAFVSHDSLVFDGQGRIVTRISYTTESGSSGTRTSYAYTGDNHLFETVVYDLGTNAILETTGYRYENGNITGADSTRYAYYSDRPFQNGDYWQLQQLLQDGLVTVRNANLLQRVQQTGGGITNFTYNFNSEGRISRLNGFGGGNDFTMDVDHFCY